MTKSKAKQQQEQQQEHHLTEFDPFDVFDGVEEEKSAKAKGGESNPWSDSSWGIIHSAAPPPPSSSLSSAPSTRNIGAEEEGYAQEMLFPSDPMAMLLPQGDADLSVLELATKETDQLVVRVIIREQFATLYDDQGSPPSCNLEGSIHVQLPPAPTYFANKGGLSSSSLRVLVHDPQSNIVSLDEVDPNIVSNVSTTQDIEYNTTVFQLHPPLRNTNNDASEQNTTTVEIPIATYTCHPQLRPIPMLVKSRVQMNDNVSRVGFKIRANPSNTEALNNLVILVAVPPFVQGETVKMSRKGGIWDDLKRTICWNARKLEPGEVLEIQAQFQSSNHVVGGDLQFPILVRADVPHSFSGISVATKTVVDGGDSTNEDNNNEPEPTIKHTVTRSTRILHRKV